ncbi:hypothetical protein MPL3356_460006 [Mesorhizobium plurifarium]|uniref:Uncharacterized protein n=1 Tax=Mesorhizobium plurifarium TaxID=69974 RepID=A0A090G1F3_MESPL|nr:hypothetical protein MPL3356_460006 [Mesorhizobium plurifarium]
MRRWVRLKYSERRLAVKRLAPFEAVGAPKVRILSSDVGTNQTGSALRGGASSSHQKRLY